MGIWTIWTSTSSSLVLTLFLCCYAHRSLYSRDLRWVTSVWQEVEEGIYGEVTVSQILCQEDSDVVMGLFPPFFFFFSSQERVWNWSQRHVFPHPRANFIFSDILYNLVFLPLFTSPHHTQVSCKYHGLDVLSTCLFFSFYPLNWFYPAPLVAFLYLPFGELFLAMESSTSLYLLPSHSCTPYTASLVFFFRGSAVIPSLCFSILHHHAAVLNIPVYTE